MTPAAAVSIAGTPTALEAAAIAAAVEMLLAGAPPEAELPWPYRSAWRRAAIDEGVHRTDVS